MTPIRLAMAPGPTEESESLPFPPTQWAELLRELEGTVDGAGWDQPSRLFAAYPASAGDPRASGVRVELVIECDDHPQVALRGVSAIGAGAVILLTEGWTAEPGPAGDLVYQPRESPHRQEVRIATLISAEGQHLLLTRLRGEEAELQPAPVLSGPIPDLLRRVLRMDLLPTSHTTGEFLGLLALKLAVRPFGGDQVLGGTPTGMYRCIDLVHDDVTQATELTVTGPAELARELSWRRVIAAPAFLGVEWLSPDMALWLGPDALANLLCEQLWGPYSDALRALRALTGEEAAAAVLEELVTVGWGPPLVDDAVGSGA